MVLMEDCVGELSLDDVDKMVKHPASVQTRLKYVTDAGKIKPISQQVILKFSKICT